MKVSVNEIRTKHHEQWIKECHRYVGDRLASALIRTSFTPTQLTIFRFLCAAAAALLIALNSGHKSLILAAIGIYLFSMVDAADGSLARLKKNGTLVGAWLDRQADGLAFLLIFLALAARFSSEGASGVYWAIVTIAVLTVALLNKSMEIGLRTKAVLQNLSKELRNQPEYSLNSQKSFPREGALNRSFATTLKRQISPDFHTISTILIVGLVLNKLKITVVVLLAFLSLWWMGRTFQVYWLARKCDKRFAETNTASFQIKL